MKNHYSAVLQLATESEVHEALVLSGFSNRYLRGEDISGNDDTGFTTGVRYGLDPTFRELCEFIGFEGGDLITTTRSDFDRGLTVARLITESRERESAHDSVEQTPSVMHLTSIGDLDQDPGNVIVGGDIDADVDALAELDPETLAAGRALAGAVNNVIDRIMGGGAAEPEADVVLRPVDLVCTIESTDAATVDAALEIMIGNLAEVAGGYEAGARAINDGVTTVSLRAITDGEEWLCNLPNGTMIFENPLPANGQNVATRAVVAGDLDPENPPLVMGDWLTNAFLELEQIGTPIPDAPLLVLRMERLDGNAFDEASLQAPLAQALANLSVQMGQVRAGASEVGDTDSVRYVQVFPNDPTNMVARGTAHGIGVGFTGTLPFPGIGRVKVSAVPMA